jgi:competence protein ComEC
VDRRLCWLDLGARPALFPALFLALGASFGPGLAGSPTSWLIFAFLATCAALLHAPRTGAQVGLLLGCLLLGIGLSRLALGTIVPDRLREGGQARLEGVVQDVLVLPDATRVDLAVSHAPDESPSQVRFRVRLYARNYAGRLQPGQRILVKARFRPMAGPSNPGEADFSGQKLRRGLLFSGGFDPAGLVVLSPPSAATRWMDGARGALARTAREAAPSPEAAALYLTLAAGLRADLGDELEERFSASGLAHVLSVSGLHVALLAVLLLRLLRALTVRLSPRARTFDARRLAAPLAIPLVWGYVIFTGNQMPAIRSAVMASAVLVGMALWKRADALNGLALAAMALVAFDPASVADLSTRLSFLAVAALVVISPAVRDAVPLAEPDPRAEGLRRRWARGLETTLSTFCASVAVVSVSAPLIASAFHRLSLAGLISNVVSLPLCGVLTALSAGGAALHVGSEHAARPVVWLGTWASWLLLRVVELFAAMPGASIPVPSFGPFAGALFVVSLFVFALARGRWRLGGLGAPLALVAVFLPPALPTRGLEVTFLSVGHGDAAVLSSGRSHALVDGGGAPGGADTGKRYVIPFLREKGISSLDLAVLSHPHADHALGLISALGQVPARRLWLPKGDERGVLTLQLIATAARAEIEEVEQGHPPFRLGEALIEVLGPPEDRLLLEGVNDRSVVLRVRHGEVSFLLTGDIEEAAEEHLDPGTVTVMKAPHHGSPTSSTAPFVGRARPRHVVFCVGRRSRFGFPNAEVVARYEAVGARCHRTDLHGAVTFKSDGRDVKVRHHLAPEPPLARSPPALVAGEGRPHP